MHKIHLMAADSRCATPEELADAGLNADQYPPGWTLMAHQARTVKALRSGSAPIVINSAMTGDGKSLAGQLQVFNDRSWRTLTMYPTNELAVDQKRGLKSLFEKPWHPPVWQPHGLQYEVLDADKLDAVQEDYERLAVDLKRAEVLQHILQNDYILTNPDIFHLTISFAYRQFGRARDISLSALARRYRLFVFDEFHLYGTPQTTSVMLALLLLQQMSTNAEPPRFLFLSATPQTYLHEMAQKLGVGVEEIKGEYQDGLATPPENYRRILQAADLTLYSGGLEEWCQAHLEDVILRFFREQRPAGAKGVIISNSIASAHRIRDFLSPICHAHGIRVGLNTGLIPKADRVGEFDLLVGTSTIDVGVDFKINLLIFECTDDASHLQRLGRLGRHEKDAQGQPFAVFEAHALVPPWVVEGITQAIPAGGITSRANYRRQLSECFTPQERFTRYTTRWAGIQAGQILNQLRSPEIKTQYAEILPILKEQFYQLFGKSVNRYFKIMKDETCLPIIDSAAAFRGDSPFTAIVREMKARDGVNGWVSYNLITILRNSNLEYVSFSEMERDYLHLGQKAPRLSALHRGDPLGAFRISGWVEGKPREVNICASRELEEAERETVIVMRGFRFEVMANIPGLRQVNDALETRALVCFLIPNRKPDDVRRMCRLGVQIQLLRLKTSGGAIGTAAFGRDALMLDSVWLKRRGDADGPMIY